MARAVMAIKKPIPTKFTEFKQLGDHLAVFASDESPTGFAIMTLENTKVKYEVTPGDWICDGKNGDVYAIKPEIFSDTYTIIEEV